MTSLEQLRQANEEFAATVRRFHPENVTPREWVKFRELFLRRLAADDRFIERLIDLTRQRDAIIEACLGRRDSRRGDSADSSAG